MSEWRKSANKLKFIQVVCSLKLTVIGLIFLTILTFWGTLYQTKYGLFFAQERFFHSWVFHIWKVIPFPGAKLVMMVLFINLVFTMIFRFRFVWKNLGLLMLHSGLLGLLLGGGITFYFAQESQLTLKEGESSRYSESYKDWEIAFWKPAVDSVKVYGLPVNNLSAGDLISIPIQNVGVEIMENYPNAQGFLQQVPSILNGSGVGVIQEKDEEKEPEKNIPAVQFILNISGNKQKVILFGLEENITKFIFESDTLCMKLRRVKYLLPARITLIDFKRDLHPGTEMASAYESTVGISSAHEFRNVKIYMNNPLLLESWVFYQASFAQLEEGQEQSTLAIVKNPSRNFPYISSLFTGFGLILHFIIALFRVIQKRKEGSLAR